MLIQEWGVVLWTSLQNLGAGFIEFIPKLIIAILLFIVGWVVGALIGKWVMQIVEALKLDKLFRGTGMDRALSKSGLKLNIGAFIGGIVKWFVIIAFLIPSLEILGLTEVNQFLTNDVLGYLPRVFVAALVLVAATLVSDLVKAVVVSSAETARVSSANLLGAIAKYAIWVFALIIALNELGVAQWFMQELFRTIILMFAATFALAFGLGGRDAASRAIDNVRSEMSSRGD